jgi:hypothetical protein
VKTIELTAREARVTASVMLTISAYTEQECREHFGWTKADIDAWSTAHRKIDDAATTTRREKKASGSRR